MIFIFSTDKPNMKVEDVTNTLDQAIATLGVSEKPMPKLLSYNGSCYVSHELANYIQEDNMKHVRKRTLHHQTQVKMERYHRSMKNIVKLDDFLSTE